MIIEKNKALELLEKLVGLENEEIEFCISGGISFDVGCRVKEVTAMGFDKETISSFDTIFFKTDKGDFQITPADLTEINYECKETMASIVLSFNDHYVHIYE